MDSIDNVVSTNMSNGHVDIFGFPNTFFWNRFDFDVVTPCLVFIEYVIYELEACSVSIDCRTITSFVMVETDVVGFCVGSFYIYRSTETGA